MFEFGERTPPFDPGRRRMSSKSLAVDRELVSSLQGTLLQFKVRRQLRRGRTGLCLGGIKAGCARERGRARGARAEGKPC